MKLPESEQTNEFEIHEEVLNNLSEGEKILYKLKVIKKPIYSKLMKRLMKIIIGISVIYMLFLSIMSIIREGILVFTNLFSWIGFIFPILVILAMYFYVKKVTNLNEISYLYITNKKLFKIYKTIKVEKIETLLLTEIQGISVIPVTPLGKQFQVEITSERISYYSKYLKGRSYNFPVLYDLQNVIQIIESILWHSGDMKERLEQKKRELDIHLPLIFSDLNLSSTIELYNDKILYKKDDYSLEIPFSQGFYMSYQPRTKKSGFINFRPFYESEERIKVKLNENYLKIMELIYLHLLSWKNDKKLLLDENTLEKFLVKSTGLTPQPTLED